MSSHVANIGRRNALMLILDGIEASRLWFVAATAIYLAVFVGTYFAFTSTRWDYWGLGVDPNWRIEEMALFVVLALWPAFVLPAKMQRPSDLFLMFQYSLVYIPTLFLAQHSRLPVLDQETRQSLCLAVVLGFAIMIWARRTWRPLKLPHVRVRPGALWTGMVVALALSLVALVALLGSNFRIVSLADIYDVRRGVDKILEGSAYARIGGYPFFWSNNVFLPLLFAYALFRRSYLSMGLVVLGYLFLFGIWGAKMSLLAPIYLLLFYVALSLSRATVLPTMIAGLTALLVVPAVLPESGLLGVISDWWIAIVHARTFAIPSVLIVQYIDFFQHHSLTLGSHITGINLLVEYPYDLDVSQTVGYHYYGHLVTSNVNFWAQDGLAGFGPAGILPASLVASIVLWFADSAAAGLRLRFVGTVLGAVFLSFLTTSIFTTLLTGGLFLQSLFFWLLPRDGRSFWSAGTVAAGSIDFKTHLGRL
jgi:hypothetical protein